MSILEKFGILFLTLISLFLLIVLVHSITNIPLVHMSHGTAECVKVQSSQNYTCDNLPTKYEVIWVK